MNLLIDQVIQAALSFYPPYFLQKLHEELNTTEGLLLYQQHQPTTHLANTGPSSGPSQALGG